MKKIVLITLALLGVFACIGKIGPVIIPTGVVTIEAQSLPVNKTLVWNAGANATSYTVTLDGVLIGSPTVLQQAFSIATVGNHTFVVTSVNMWGTASAAPFVVNVVLPSVASGFNIQ